MTRRTVLLVSTPLVALALGCDVDPSAEFDDETILLRIAESEGFDVSEAEYDGELLLIDDIAFGPEHLADADEVLADDPQFRGYLRTTAVSKSRLDVCLVMDDVGADVPDVSWFWAFASAIYQWNARPDTDIDIRFKYQSDPDDDWCDGRDIINVAEGDTNGNLALAQYPYGSGSDRRVGGWIRLLPGSTASYKTAMHEIGHNFAFAHPDDPNGTRIAGTQDQSTNYPSVMWRNNTGPAQNNALTELTDDDIESIERTYGNTTFLVPASFPVPKRPALPFP